MSTLGTHRPPRIHACAPGFKDWTLKALQPGPQGPRLPSQQLPLCPPPSFCHSPSATPSHLCAQYLFQLHPEPSFPLTCWQYLAIYNICSTGNFGLQNYSNDLDSEPSDPQNMQIKSRDSLFSILQYKPGKLWCSTGKNKNKKDIHV